jgi:integrase
MLSLRTREWREAEYLAALLDDTFEGARRRVLAEGIGEAERLLRKALKEALRDALEADLKARTERAAPIYATWWDAAMARPSWDIGSRYPRTAQEADLEEIEQAVRNLRDALEAGHGREAFAHEVATLAARQGVPENLQAKLTVGYLEAKIEAWRRIAGRTQGLEPLVFDPVADDTAGPDGAGPATSPAFASPLVPLASALVEPYFAKRQTDGSTHQVISQDRTTLRRFIETAGDRPIDSYGRGDVTVFRETMGRLPVHYGKSPADKDKSLAVLIAEAVNAGHMTVQQRTEIVADHTFKVKKGARDQRDQWLPEELAALFASPVWAGHSRASRNKPGPIITRDAKFWLPLLAVFQGARLEELADLYRRDVVDDGGVWTMHIVESEGRRLKNVNSTRVIPLHPELIRLGFLNYVTTTAALPDAPLFPDLQPQGKDQKRGPRFTRWFVEYRRKTGTYREDVATHAFRHTANTRLRDSINGIQQDRHVDFLFGHARTGSEGRERYDKGPGLKALAATLGLLAYPEIDLSRLYSSAASEGVA